MLLVSSRGSSKGWCVPKGGWEDDESVEAAAKRETVEEAGVRGTIEEVMLGPFAFSSGSKKATKTGCIAYIFVLHVAEELEVWPEGHERRRSWFSLADAGPMLKHSWMRDSLFMWVQRKWGEEGVLYIKKHWSDNIGVPDLSSYLPNQQRQQGGTATSQPIQSTAISSDSSVSLKQGGSPVNGVSPTSSVSYMGLGGL